MKSKTPTKKEEIMTPEEFMNWKCAELEKQLSARTLCCKETVKFERKRVLEIIDNGCGRTDAKKLSDGNIYHFTCSPHQLCDKCKELQKQISEVKNGY